MRMLLLILFGAAVLTPPADAQFMKGADLSLLQFIQDHGVQYKEAGQAKDPLLIFKDHGCNYVRLRLFVSPNGNEGQVNNLPYTLKLARRAKDAGLKFLLDLHYSDGWADPGHQIIPAAWKGLTHEQVTDRLFVYTRETLAAFHHAGAMPDMVEIGNEITNGMDWPDAGPMSDAKKWNDGLNPEPSADGPWDRFADLLKAGTRGVRENDPDHAIKIMIHIDKGGSKTVSRWFFDHLQQRGVSFDVIGLSYYPFWHGTFDDLKANLDFLSSAYQKDIVVVETGFDTYGGAQKNMPFPITPAGQKSFMEALIRVVAATPGGHGGGVCYWAPEWIEGKKWDAPAWSGQWESRAFFDENGNTRPVLDAYRLPVPQLH